MNSCVWLVGEQETKQCVQARLQTVPPTWNQRVSSARRATRGAEVADEPGESFIGSIDAVSHGDQVCGVHAAGAVGDDRHIHGVRRNRAAGALACDGDDVSGRALLDPPAGANEKSTVRPWKTRIVLQAIFGVPVSDTGSTHGTAQIFVLQLVLRPVVL